MTASPRVDAHQHFWRLDRGDYGWLTPALAPLFRDHQPEDLVPLLAERHIEHTVLVQAAPTDDETDYLLALADAHPFVAAVVGWVDMADAGAPARLESLARHPKFRGIRPMIQDIDDDDWMLRRDLTAAFESLVALDLRFDALVMPRHLANLARLLDRHPDLRVVIDHGAKPDIAGGGLDTWRERLQPLCTRPGVHCKLSGLVTEAVPDWETEHIRPYAEELLAAFGPDRLMWGSDWPVVNLAGGYAAWWSLTEELLRGVSSAATDAILGGTAAGFYGLGELRDD